jgi:fatty-acyl-CoA synthase
VVVCGRVKDVIIMGGRNIYPTDIERAAQSVPGVRAGNAAAVRLSAGQRRESFAVVVESRAAADEAEAARIADQVRSAVTAAMGVRPATVTVVPAGTLPKTPSGKIRRAAAADLAR